MPEQTTPESGDVVVRKEKREGRVVYVLHTPPGADQYLLRTREEAIAEGVTFAKHHGVRVWLSDERNDCTMLDDFRAAESV
jgi:hypothetical protein